MKRHIHILFILFTINSFAQNALIIEFKPEKEMYNEPDYHIYKNDSLVFSNCSLKNEGKNIYNLKKGKYLIRYNTVFGIDSLVIDFKTGFDTKFITLENEYLSNSKLDTTYSEIESLFENEKLTLKYHLGGCFVSESKEMIITKINGKYYRLNKGRKKKIRKKNIQNIINYEKTIRNLNIEENIDETMKIVTCSEFISIEKNGKTVYSKNIFCGDWSKSSEIKKWIKQTPTNKLGL